MLNATLQMGNDYRNEPDAYAYAYIRGDLMVFLGEWPKRPATCLLACRRQSQAPNKLRHVLRPCLDPLNMLPSPRIATVLRPVDQSIRPSASSVPAGTVSTGFNRPILNALPSRTCSCAFPSSALPYACGLADQRRSVSCCPCCRCITMVRPENARVCIVANIMLIARPASVSRKFSHHAMPTLLIMHWHQLIIGTHHRVAIHLFPTWLLVTKNVRKL